MSKAKQFFITVFIAAVITGLLVGLYALVSSDVSLARAAAKTRREFDKRLGESAFSVLLSAYEYPRVDASVDYAGIHAAAELYLDAGHAAVGGGIFGDRSYGVTFDLGAELGSLVSLSSLGKPVITEDDATGAAAMTYRFTHEKYGDTTAVFTVFRRRLATVTVTADGFDLALDFGENARDNWTANLNGTAVTWRIAHEDDYSRDWLTLGEHTIGTSWDTRIGSFGLRIDDLQTNGSLVVNREDFRLKLDGRDGFTLLFSGTRNAEAENPSEPEFIDIGGDYAAFGDVLWDALGTLYGGRIEI